MVRKKEPEPNKKELTYEEKIEKSIGESCPTCPYWTGKKCLVKGDANPRDANCYDLWKE